jgi:hypothetical protein
MHYKELVGIAARVYETRKRSRGRRRSLAISMKHATMRKSENGDEPKEAMWLHIPVAAIAAASDSKWSRRRA